MAAAAAAAAAEELTAKQKHQLNQRELFLSRQVETLPATNIRGKCSVTLLNETEAFASYLDKEVVRFFFFFFFFFVSFSGIESFSTKFQWVSKRLWPVDDSSGTFFHEKKLDALGTSRFS